MLAVAADRRPWKRYAGATSTPRGVRRGQRDDRICLAAHLVSDDCFGDKGLARQASELAIAFVAMRSRLAAKARNSWIASSIAGSAILAGQGWRAPRYRVGDQAPPQSARSLAAAFEHLKPKLSSLLFANGATRGALLALAAAVDRDRLGRVRCWERALSARVRWLRLR